MKVKIIVGEFLKQQFFNAVNFHKGVSVDAIDVYTFKKYFFS